MVELKIRKFGKSLGVVLPKEMISRLQISDGREALSDRGKGRDYSLTSHDPEGGKKMGKAKKIMSRYRNTLNALSK